MKKMTFHIVVSLLISGTLFLSCTKADTNPDYVSNSEGTNKNALALKPARDIVIVQLNLHKAVKNDLDVVNRIISKLNSDINANSVLFRWSLIADQSKVYYEMMAYIGYSAASADSFLSSQQKLYESIGKNRDLDSPVFQQELASIIASVGVNDLDLPGVSCMSICKSAFDKKIEVLNKYTGARKASLERRGLLNFITETYVDIETFFIRQEVESDYFQCVIACGKK